MQRCAIRWLAAAVALTGAIAALLTFLYEWDPTRVTWKRLTAENRYVYEESHPRFLETDPAELIRIADRQDAAVARLRLTSAIFGSETLPRDRMPDRVEAVAADSRQAELAGLHRVERLTIDLPAGFTGHADILHPENPAGRIVLFQNGHGGTGSYLDHGRHIERLLAAGHIVVALNLPSGLPVVDIPGIGRYQLHPWRALDLVEYPLRLHFLPVVVAINHVTRNGPGSIDMIGFSAGGWITMVASAIDTRIRRSYPVAGAYPLYLRSGEEHNQSPRPQYHRPLITAANYLEMFVLAAHGENRRQLQVFNRYDRCCYNNVKARLYEPAVRDAVAALGNPPESFAVLIDETHARHKISDWAMGMILEDLARP